MATRFCDAHRKKLPICRHIFWLSLLCTYKILTNSAVFGGAIQGVGGTTLVQFLSLAQSNKVVGDDNDCHELSVNFAVILPL